MTSDGSTATQSDDIMAVVRDLLADTLEIHDRADRFDASTPLLGGLPELDSMAVLAVLTALEDRFDITIEDDEFSGAIFDTLGTLTAFVQSKRAGG